MKIDAAFNAPSAAALLPSKPPAGTAGAGASAPDGSFGAVFASMLQDVNASLRSAEHLSIGALTGDVPLQKAVEAVVSAEQKVQLTTAVRDKIVAAYLDLARMQI
ncbi:MAG: flagellar hook-basal body complex protein FliE [Hyphomicrobium sp.]|nr:flagellar hook-basal body complex protein FliE [Hyphomicrobium sp.]